MNYKVTKIAMYVLICILLATNTAHSGSVKSQGFMGLRWGMSPKEAHRVFPDLELKVKPNQKEVGKGLNIVEESQKYSYEYERNKESFMLGEIIPNNVRYIFFNNAKFIGISASAGYIDLDGNGGAEKYESEKLRFGGSYFIIKSNIESKYGAPTKHKKDNIGYEAEWDVPDATIKLFFIADDSRRNMVSIVFGITSKLGDRLEKEDRSKKLGY
jgi:hypothetical protein